MSADSKAREAALIAAIDSACTRAGGPDISSLQHLVSSALDEATPISIARTVLKHLYGALDNLPVEQNETVEAAAGHAVEYIKRRVSVGTTGLEEPDYRLRYLLYRIHLGDEDFLRAGSVLGGAPIDSPSVCLSDEEKCLAYVKVAQAYLRGDDDVNADRFVKRAGEFLARNAQWEVTAQYKVCYAMILDAKRKFLDAALRYAELSTLGSDVVNEADLLGMLEKAAKCAVLAPAGPTRQNFMGSLYRDERIRSIHPLVFHIFERMYLERIIPPADAAKFEGALQAHQKATTSDGSTIFARALVEHNLLAASKVYSSVTFSSLSDLLGIDAGKAEKVACKMITERRIAARVDQVDGMLDFNGGQAEVSTAGASAPAPASVPQPHGKSTVAALSSWNGAIKDLCGGVNKTIDAIAKSHPGFVPDGGL